MAKLKWFPDGSDLAERAEELIGALSVLCRCSVGRCSVGALSVLCALIKRAGGRDVVGAALYRKNDHLRVNAKIDPYALKAWCWQVLARANENSPKANYVCGL